jgi:transcriptional regulator with XRE-family HTH domain
VQDVQLGRVVRALRRRRGWRQSDVAARAGVDRSTISLIERGQVRGLTVETLRRCIAPLAASAELGLRWRGPELDRLLDERHAGVQSAWKGRLDQWGWAAEAEASFNRYGERGRVDLLAWHPATGILLVVEVKTELVDLQDLLGRLDVKRRLAPWLARERDWPRPKRVATVLLLPDSSTARQVVRRLAPLFAPFDLRGRAAVAALRRPALLDATAATGLLIFSDLRPATGARVTSVARTRVRRRPGA